MAEQAERGWSRPAWWRLGLAFLFAPLLPLTLLITVLSLIAGDVRFSGVGLMISLYVAIPSWVIGPSAYGVVRRKVRLTLGNVLAAGAILAAGVTTLIMILVALSGFSVWMLLVIPFAAVLGAVGGLFFWAIAVWGAPAEPGPPGS